MDKVKGAFTCEHRMSGVADEDESVLVPCRDGFSSNEFPKFHVSSFSVGILSVHRMVYQLRYWSAYLTTFCTAGAKCFVAYSSAILGATIARKSIRVIGCESLVKKK